jgi:2-oxoglutarate ferredoxin oxidoreductase subunit alpha
MQENLGLAVMGEVPCVVINVQRSGPSTGLATKPAQSDLMQLRWGRHGDQTVIALCPATVKECFSLAVTAFNFAEKFRIPVVLAPDEVVAHMRENMVMPEAGAMEVINRKKPAASVTAYKPFDAGENGIAPLAAYGDDCVFHITSSMHGPDGYSNNDPANAAWRVAQLHRKLQLHRDEIVMTKAFDAEDADVLLIAFGITTRASRAAAAALRKQGIKAGVLQLITLWPFADREVARYGSNAKTVVVTEMNYSGQMAGEVQKVLGREADIRKVNKFNGQIITPQEILDGVHGPKA